MTTAPKYEVRNVRFTRGSHDDVGFLAKLYLDGKLVADLVDDGHGGEIEIRWTRRDPKAPHAQDIALQKHVNTLPSQTYLDTELKMTVDLFLGTMVEEIEIQQAKEADHKRLVKICQKKVLFRTAADVATKKTVWRTYQGLFTAKMRQMVVDKHGADCVFANETIVGQVAAEGAAADAKAKALQDAAFRAKVIRDCRKDVKFRTADNEWRVYRNRPYTLRIQALIDAQYPGSFVANREWAGQVPA